VKCYGVFLFLFFLCVCGMVVGHLHIGHQLLEFSCCKCPVAVQSRIGLAEKTGYITISECAESLYSHGVWQMRLEMHLGREGN